MSFLQPKTASPPPPAPPVIEDTSATQQQTADKLRMRQGRAAAILSPAGGYAAPTTASKTLLGS